MHGVGGEARDASDVMMMLLTFWLSHAGRGGGRGSACCFSVTHTQIPIPVCYQGERRWLSRPPRCRLFIFLLPFCCWLGCCCLFLHPFYCPCPLSSHFFASSFSFIFCLHLCIAGVRGAEQALGGGVEDGKDVSLLLLLLAGLAGSDLVCFGDGGSGGLDLITTNYVIGLLGFPISSLLLWSNLLT